MLGAGADAERQRAKPVGPAGEVGRALALAAAIRELVISAGPLSGGMLLRSGNRFLGLAWLWFSWVRTRFVLCGICDCVGRREWWMGVFTGQEQSMY